MVNYWLSLVIFTLMVVSTLDLCVAKVIYVNGQAGNDNNPGSATAPVKTLSAALSLAATSGDAINVAAGVYSGSLNFPVINKSVTIAGLAPTLIAFFECSNSDTLNIAASTSVTLRNVEFRACRTAINLTAATLTMKQAVFVNCTTGINATQSDVRISLASFFFNSNAAINLDNCKTTISNAFFRSNTLGVLTRDSVVNITSTAFRYNRQTSPTLGAAMHFISSFVSLSALNVEKNAAVNGAGMYAIGSTVSVTRSDFIDSSAGTPIWLQGTQLMFTYGNINNNTVAGNGGALTSTANSFASITFSNILENTAGQQGSPFYCSTGGGAFASTANNNIRGNIAASNPEGNC